MGVINKKPYEISIWEDRLKTVEIPETVKFTIPANDTYTYTLPKEAATEEVNISPAEVNYTEEESTHTYTFVNDNNTSLTVSIAFNKNKSYYEEVKIAVIGSDRMTHPNRAFDPVLTENVNGEKTLTFSIAYRYYDPLLEEIVSNPFVKYLINERKVKLFYNNEWSEFLIKECEESSEDYIFKYTARELFSLELSKTGYGITLDQSLNNNQGTILELGAKALEGTDWQIDEENSDLLQQYIQEPIYICKVADTTEISVLNLDTNKEEFLELTENTPIYVFYSQINNRVVSNVQFIWEGDRSKFKITDDHVIKSTNYRFLTDIIYNDEVKSFSVDNVTFTIGLINYSNQAYRLVYGPLTTYDPIMNRTVDIYEAQYNDSKRTIYHYADYTYSTSDIVVSYLANGSNFNTYENGTLQGWSNKTPVSETDGKSILQPISLTTRPEISPSAPLKMIDSLGTIEGFLKLKFAGTLTENYENTYFNEGLEYNTSSIDHISAGEKFALRLRFLTGNTETQEILDKYDPTEENDGIRAIIATYTTNDQKSYLDDKDIDKENKIASTIKSNQINPKEIVLDFNKNFKKSPNIISNGVFDVQPEGDVRPTRYIVDTVVQTPSTLYIYKDKKTGIECVWSSTKRQYILKEEADFFSDYYITTATARLSYSNDILADPTFHLGIFIYTKDEGLVNKWVFVQDIQLTRYYEVKNEETGEMEPILIGNVPRSVSTPTHYFYLKPDEGIQQNEITTYGNLDYLAADLGLDKDNIKQVYNEDCEKILSIQASQSNCFNILQDLCETFECWLQINVQHDKEGKIVLDENYNPIKKIAFKEYCGKENFSGFKNGINLVGINRQIDSNEIVTKLIVDSVQSEFSDTGSISIQDAKSNPSGESTIINLSYYLNRGLITDVDSCNKDLTDFNSILKEKNDKIKELQVANSQEQIALTRLAAKRTTYTALIDEANKTYNQALEDFKQITGLSYNEYVNQVEQGEVSEDTEKKVRSDSALQVVSEIYAAQSTITNYSGILTNLNEEYKQLDFKCNGAKEYEVTVSFIPGIEEDGELTNPSVKVVFSDYVSGFGFKLINGTGNEEGYVYYQTSPNDKIFIISAPNIYEKIQFINILSNYNLKYFNGNNSFEIKHDMAKQRIFSICGEDESIAYNRHFKFVPDIDYANDHASYKSQIDKLIEEKKEIEKNFYKKYSRFLEEGTWSSQDYIDPELYYLDALQVSDTSAEPKVTYTINVLEVSQLQNLENYDFRVGDKTYVEDTEFFGYLTQVVRIADGTQIEETEVETQTQENAQNRSTYYDWQNEGIQKPQIGIVKTPVQEEVIVSEIEWHLDEPDTNTITVQNYKTRFEDLFQRISATVQTVQRNENTYSKTTSILNSDGLISSSLLADSLSGMGGQGFLLTSNGSVASTKDGLVIKDLSNSANVMRLMSRGVEVSNDGGQNWNTAISADGISTDLLTAGTINTQNIWIMDGDNPTFRWDKAGLSAYGLDSDGNFNYNLKTYVRFDKFGLYGIKDGENYVASSLKDVREKAHFGVTWDGFFIKNTYEGGGEVSITSEDDIVVKNSNEIQKIKIGALKDESTGQITGYGIRIKDDDGNVTLETGDDGNLTMTGTINALAGNFIGEVNVGDLNNTHIVIDGAAEVPYIKSSNYQDGAGEGWIIDANGDATFSNVSVRGAIKTAVFEYEEIQAVGGAFLFRPSSTIKTARQGDTEAGELDTDLYVTVDQPLMFKIGNWVKISNYNSMSADSASDLTTYGLVHIYKIKDIVSLNFEGEGEGEEPEPELELEPEEIENSENNDTNSEEEKWDFTPTTNELVLEGGATILDSVALENIPGGALIDFGVAEGTYVLVTPKETDNPHAKGWYELDETDYVLTEDTTVDSEKTYYKEAYENGRYNYGIGINSSDNYVNLPARAISLFETTIHPEDTTKVTYNYRGILGTLPTMSDSGGDAQVAPFYNQNMAGTQGIYTDNMYIGDESQYVAFYEDGNHQKQLKIRANQIMFEISDPEPGQDPWKDIADIEAEGVPGPPGQDAIRVEIDSTAGNFFQRGQVNTYLIAHVYSGSTDITSQFNHFNWYRRLPNGERDTSWSTQETSNLLQINTSDVDERAVFVCEVALS